MTADSTVPAAVADHYAHPGLLETVERGPRLAGADRTPPRLEDLAPLDQFHTRGLEATVTLAALANLEEDRLRVVEALFRRPA